MSPSCSLIVFVHIVISPVFISQASSHGSSLPLPSLSTSLPPSPSVFLLFNPKCCYPCSVCDADLHHQCHNQPRCSLMPIILPTCAPRHLCSIRDVIPSQWYLGVIIVHPVPSGTILICYRFSCATLCSFFPTFSWIIRFIPRGPCSCSSGNPVPAPLYHHWCHAPPPMHTSSNRTSSYICACAFMH